MGSISSKFRKHLQRGDEYAVMHIYERHPDLRKSLNPSVSLGEPHYNNTYLHYACRHAMKALIRSFLYDHNGNPNKHNMDEQTCLHVVCQSGTRHNASHEARLRSDCLALLLNWKESGDNNEGVNINAVDAKKNTPLHYAAMSGLRRCVEMLVSRGADMFLENDGKETPCDCAERCGHKELAEYLETKMVFSCEHEDQIGKEEEFFVVNESYSGLREQDLREAKDLLLVETSDMLRVPLFTAEALLRNHEWSREELLDSWMRDAVVCCEKSGVQPPPSAQQHRPPPRAAQSSSSAAMSDGASDMLKTTMVSSSTSKEPTPVLDYADDEVPLSSPLLRSPAHGKPIECAICAEMISGDCPLSSVCGHQFCKQCWKHYLTGKIQEGDLSTISCPAFQCTKLVPIEVIERVVSPTVARKYLKFDIKAFVESNPKIKWCPHPGCTNAVRLPDVEEPPPLHVRAFPRLQPPPATSRTVHCLNGHAFCWECMAEGHEPTSCDKWKEWHEKIAQVKPEELKGTAEACENAANCLWLITHSKPCPKCKSPIQKNEGCNHMKCSKCKHDFCWVCLGPWKKHSTDTGGYFRCNRYDDTRKIEERTESAVNQAKEHNKRSHELNKFVHYYSRFKNHLNSYEMEKQILLTIDAKIHILSQNAPRRTSTTSESSLTGGEGSSATGPVDMSFVKEAVNELLRSRKVLSSSYAYGYFLKDCGYNKTIFEYLQNELEVTVESLSGMVGRSYLRGSKPKIVQTTSLVRQRRHSFMLCISRGLLPPETPPNLRKLRKRHLPGILGIDFDEEDWMKAGTPPLEDVDPDRPWVKDTRGRHRNVLTLLDWPEYDSEDEDSEVTVAADTGPCGRPDCPRGRARNPRTGALHAFCSLRCQCIYKSEEGALPGSSKEYNVDLMIALQMSRLQLLHDLKLLCDEDSPVDLRRLPRQQLEQQLSASAVPRQELPFGEDVDPDMQLAIERSMSERQSSMDASAGVPLELECNAESPDVCHPPPPNEQELKLFLRRFAAKEMAQQATVGANLFCQDQADAAHDKVDKPLLCGSKGASPRDSALICDESVPGPSTQ